LHTEERHRAEELALVNRIARQVNASLDLRLTLNTIVEAVAELVPCSLAEISLWDPEKEVLILQALRCDPERAFHLGQVYPPGKGYTGWVVRNKRPLLVPDVAAREDIQPDLLPGELPFKAYLGLPLLCCDQLIGTLVLIHARRILSTSKTCTCSSPSPNKPLQPSTTQACISNSTVFTRKHGARRRNWQPSTP
jgi:GAF domain-containing protein